MDPNIPLLLVEDDPDLREALGEYFEVCGFSVRAAATAAEALTWAREWTPRIILTDLRLPDLKGDALLRELHRLHPSCLLYLHSGDSAFVPGDELAACGLTPDHVLSKPAELAAMVAQFHNDLAKN